MKYITKQKFEEECIVLKESILELSDRQEAMMTEFKNDMSTVKSLLIEIGGRGPRGGEYSYDLAHLLIANLSSPTKRWRTEDHKDLYVMRGRRKISHSI